MSIQITLRTAMAMLALTLALPGCGLIQRSSGATNVEDGGESQGQDRQEGSGAGTPHPQSSSPSAEFEPEGPDAKAYRASRERAVAPAPQRVQGNAQASLERSERLYVLALREQEQGAFLKASRHWQEFLDQHVGMPGYSRAKHNQAVCLFTLGRAAEAIPLLKDLLNETGDSRLANDSRIVLAESLLQAGSKDEALATTYEVLPNLAAEKEVGLGRASDAVGASPSTAGPDLVQKIRLYTIRGRIYSALGRDEEARAALDKAKLLLVHAPRNKISGKDFQFLSANYAWRQIEVQALVCQNRVRVPERLSEAEFLDYAHAYYSCAAPARTLYCTVLAARNEQVRSQAERTYRELFEAPLVLRDRLPPPAREIRKQEQRSHYEREMKALIEKTVEEHAREFRNIEFCKTRNVF